MFSSKFKKILGVLICVYSIGLLVGCGSDNDNASNSTENRGVKLAKNQELRIDIDSEPSSLDSAKSSDSVTSKVLINIIEPLTRPEQDENGKDIVIPAGAESWNISEDGTEYIFKLRENNWSDGKPVTANDYAYSIKRKLDPETASPNGLLLLPIKNAEQALSGEVSVDDIGVEVVDDKTLKITLEDPSTYFIELTYSLAMFPEREDIVSQYGDSYGTSLDTMGAYCGPFVMEEWVHNNKITLVKNDDYWDKDKVKLEKVEIKIITDDNALMGELMNGSLDMADVSSPEWIEKLEKTGKFTNMSSVIPRTEYMFFNQKHELLSNQKIRAAFSIAVDREGMQEAVFNDLKKAAYGWITEGIMIGDDEFRTKVGKDPVKQLKEKYPDPKQLLVEGLKELGVSENPNDHTIKILLPGTDQEEKDMGEFLQHNFEKELGIKIELEPVEWPIFQSRNRSLDYEIGYKSRGGYYNDPMTLLDMWLSTSNITPTGWVNEEYDKLIQDSTKTIDQGKRYENFRRAEEILLQEDTVISPFVYHTVNIFVNKKVKGVKKPLFKEMLIKEAYIEE